ncbi:MAG: nickel-responsive transcriptional regulator NikR [Deltaproteobacteria bacterium]|nr:nickel-responsive transcriptional regulator NikR [Deltaproteobacteria bacterium]
MAGVTRFGVSMENDLLKKFDRLIAKRNYVNRSEAIRDLVRDKIVESGIGDEDAEVFGTVTFIYDHHTRGLTERLTEIQHDHHAGIISSLHVHLDHHHCLEVLVLKGRHAEVRGLAENITGARGVKHGKLTVTSPRHLA